MCTRTLRNTLAAVIAAASLTFGGLANAVFYSSSFDPPGALSFMGVGLFEFDNSCLAVDGFHTAASCNLTLRNTTLDMTDGVDTGHLNFASVLPNTIDMIDLYILAGELVGVDTAAVGFAFPGPCTGVLCGDPWWVQWGSNPDSVSLFTGGCRGNQCFTNQLPSAIAFNVTYTRVPEPGTLALLLGALGVGGLARRKTIA